MCVVQLNCPSFLSFCLPFLGFQVGITRLDQIGAFPKPKAKGKAKAKSKAKAKAKGRPKAKAQAKRKAQKGTPKAKAKAKVDRKRKQKDEVEGAGDAEVPRSSNKTGTKKAAKKTREEPVPSKVKASFARRYCPKTDPGKTWHLAVRENFEKHFAPHLKHASTQEDTRVCFIDVGSFTCPDLS